MYRIDDIPVGRENAISRSELARKWGVSDRIARRYVADLRTVDDGTNYVIVSVSRFSGYYRTNDVQEIRWFIAEMTKRIRNIVKAIKVARTVADRLEKQHQHGIIANPRKIHAAIRCNAVNGIARKLGPDHGKYIGNDGQYQGQP